MIKVSIPVNDSRVWSRNSDELNHIVCFLLGHVAMASGKWKYGDGDLGDVADALVAAGFPGDGASQLSAAVAADGLSGGLQFLRGIGFDVEFV